MLLTVLPDDFAPFGWMFVPGGGGGIGGGAPGGPGTYLGFTRDAHSSQSIYM